MPFHRVVDEVFALAERVLRSTGLYGVFFVSLVSNSIPFVALPYLVYIIVYASRFTDFRSLVLIAVVSGIGAGLGKIIIYFIGRGFSSISPASRTARNWSYLASRHKVAGFFAILFVAITPAPDDVVLIPMGFASYSIALYALAVFLGKTVHSILAVVYGRTVLNLFEEKLGLPLWLSTLLLIALTAVVIYVVGQVDWVKATELYASRGLATTLKFVLVSVADALVKPFRHLARSVTRILSFIRSRV